MFAAIALQRRKRFPQEKHQRLVLAAGIKGMEPLTLAIEGTRSADEPIIWNIQLKVGLDILYGEWESGECHGAHFYMKNG